MNRNIIDFDNFSSTDYEGGYSEDGLNIEEALDFLNGVELAELVMGLDEAEGPGDGVASVAAGVAAGSQEVAKAVQQGLQKQGVIDKDNKPKKMNPKEAFGKVTSGILNQIADPTKAALLLRNYYSRFLNMNKVPCNMINIDSKKEMSYADYTRMLKDKAMKARGSVKPASAAKPGAPAAAAKPEGKQ
jgi:hypothetical protein